MIHLGDVLTVLGFGRQHHNQLSFPVWIHFYRCGGGLGSCFGCWGSFLGRWWGVFWFWKVWWGLALLLVGLWSMVLFWGGLYYVPDIGLAVRVFANGLGDLSSIPGRVIPKTQKMVLDASLLNTQHYKVWIKGKVEQSREGVAPSPTPWCSSYRKGSLRVTLDYGRQLYFFTYIMYYFGIEFNFL